MNSSPLLKSFPSSDGILRGGTPLRSSRGPLEGEELGPSVASSSTGGGSPIPPATTPIPILAGSSAGIFATIMTEKANSVVRILCSCLKFDWEQPFRHAGQLEVSGSGFFFREDGLILTNAHVVSKAHRVWINIPSMGERRYDAQVLGVCFDADLAVLKAPTAPVTTILKMGDSNKIKIGETVVALGYPLGMKTLKLTMGVISGRTGPLLQTDAALNPGNSGGCMLNSDGEVIGINVSIVVDSQNIGFSIPSRLFSILQDQLISENTVIVRQPALGAGFQRCSEEIMQFLGSKKEGIMVISCVPGFPLHDAGVRPGDILHSCNEYQFDNFGTTEVPWSQSRASASDLVALLTHRDTPEVTWSRNGEEFTGTLNLEDANNPGTPKIATVRNMYPPYEKIDWEVIFGFVFMDVTMDHIEMFSKKNPDPDVLQLLLPIATDCSKQEEQHLIISSILTGSSWTPSFSPGILVREINGIPVNNLKSCREAIVQPVKGANSQIFFTLKTKSNEFIAIPLIQGLLEELALSETYQYKISPLYSSLLEKLSPEERAAYNRILETPLSFGGSDIPFSFLNFNSSGDLPPLQSSNDGSDA